MILKQYSGQISMDQNDRTIRNSAISYDKDLMTDRIFKGGKWFYWISLLSSMNLIFLAIGMDRNFVLGIVIPYYISGFFLRFNFGLSMVIEIIANILIIGYFTFMGILSNKMKITGFIAGLAIYILDTAIILIYIKNWTSILFHLIALFFIIQGLYSLIKYRNIYLVKSNGK